MAQDFKEILTSMMKDLDNGKPVEEIIASKMKEMNLSEESRAKVNEAVEFVDKIDAASESLGTAVNNGTSRQEWLSNHVEGLIDSLPEDMQENAEKLMDKMTEKAIENL